MRAGLLNETISILEVQITRNETGGEEKNFIETHKIKAYRKKLSASVGSGVNASEEFVSNTLVFQVRKYAFLNEDIYIRYRMNLYKVILLDLQSDNTYLITCTKENE